jgi:membrane-bound lytic murein transglycosylase B
MKIWTMLATMTLLLTMTLTAHQALASQKSWPEFIKKIRAEALSQGIRPEVFDRAFHGLTAPNKKVLRYDRTQPEKRLTFLKYRNTRADAFRIKLGRQELRKKKGILHEISRRYGVSECFIVSLWGLETSYGRFMGSFPVVKSLATLAYDNRRSAFFRKQLFYALHILNNGHVKLKDFKGEWAGASGHPQFLPSSWHNFAVDYDGDGRKDIWKTLPDALASIANYLKQNGWQTNQPWAIVVNTPSGFDKGLMGRKITKSVSEWGKLGVTSVSGQLPNGSIKASIVRPYGGPTMMIFNNFKVIMKWNRSTYYAGTVGYMAEKVCKRSL